MTFLLDDFVCLTASREVPDISLAVPALQVEVTE